MHLLSVNVLVDFYIFSLTFFFFSRLKTPSLTIEGSDAQLSWLRLLVSGLEIKPCDFLGTLFLHTALFSKGWRLIHHICLELID